MKIRFLYEDESAVVVVSGAESEGMKGAKSVDGMEAAAGSSVAAPPPVADSDTGGASVPADPGTPLAPDPGADSSVLDDASELVDDSQVTDESEDTSGLEDASDTSEATEDASMSDARLLLDTPLDTYTVTEGLLLLAVVFLALGGAIAMFRGR